MNKPDFVARTRFLSGALVNLLAQIDALKLEYDSLDAGKALTDDDFLASDITKAQFLDGISSLQHVADARGSGHATNLYRIKT